MIDETELLNKLRKVVAPAAEMGGFRPLLDEAGERHGSWEVTFFKPRSFDGDVDRFISVSFTPPHNGALTEGDIEIWEVAEMEERFTRKRVATISTTEKGIMAGEVDETLDFRFQRTIERVNGIRLEDLKESYNTRHKKVHSAAGIASY